MEEPKRTLTRQELHDLVWSTPIQKLAQQYGISDRGLSKTCERHLVPVPGRGHWAKIEAGLPSKRSPLRAVANPDLQMVHIGGRTATPQSSYLAKVLAAAKKEIAQEDLAKAEKPQEEKPEQTLSAPYPIKRQKLNAGVDAFISDLKREKVDRHGFQYLKYVRVPPSEVARVAALLTQLANQLYQHGFAFISESNRVGFTKQGSTVDFEITAPRKRIVTKSKFGWDDFDYKHIGKLRMQIYGSAQGSKKSWADGEVQKLEQELDQIVESFRINLVAERERDEKRWRDDARQAHLAHRRKLLEQRAKREVDRLEFLRWVADARREANDLRQTLNFIPQNGEFPPDFQQMIHWACSRLSELEAQTTVERIQMMLVERKLYPDPDELFDPEGDPPDKKNYWDE